MAQILTYYVPEKFSRQMGCTSKELVSWLPRALPQATLAIDEARSCCRAGLTGSGVLILSWKTLEPTRIGLLNIPQLAVEFNYEGTSESTRIEVQRYFDMATQRGGG